MHVEVRRSHGIKPGSLFQYPWQIPVSNVDWMKVVDAISVFSPKRIELDREWELITLKRVIC